MTYDAIIVGGSYAGLSAAMQLARARRRILIVDGGQRRNRFASHAHGLLGFDGVPPDEVAARGRAQVLAYPTVTWREGRVEQARATDGGFAVELGGETLTSRMLVLATGVHDRLPDVPGLEPLWGQRVFHCPYCHGYELDGAPVAVLGAGEISMHQALMLPDWSPTTLLLNGTFVPDDAQAAQLRARGVTVEAAAVASVAPADGGLAVRLADDRTLTFAGMFAVPHTSPAGTLADQLGCAMEQVPTGKHIWVSPIGETSVPGVFACGDVARASGSLALAIGDGAMAGVATHRALMFGLTPK